MKNIILVVVNLAGLIGSIYVCIVASIKASALSGVTAAVAHDYFYHLRHESWIAFFAAIVFGITLTSFVFKRHDKK